MPLTLQEKKLSQHWKICHTCQKENDETFKLNYDDVKCY